MKRYILVFILSYCLLFANKNIVLIKGGIYKIPSYEDFYTKTKPYTIKTKSFYIDKYEVSNKQFGKTDIDEDEQDYPVVKISYDEALKYCQKHNGTLPTQEQWIVASSFSNNQFYLYATKQYPITNQNNINIKEDRAIQLETKGYGADTDIVSVYDALIGNNGIVGMLGNVWEITKSNNNIIILKGGSFYNYQTPNLLNNLIQNKVYKSNLKQYEHIGFRCVYQDL
jgi:formylglycine-generating enzyme required for sulfatase activity